MKPATKAALMKVDWLRAFNRLSTLARALRNDHKLDADHETERMRAKRLTKSLDSMARNAVGCVAPKKCNCPLCRQQRG